MDVTTKAVFTHKCDAAVALLIDSLFYLFIYLRVYLDCKLGASVQNCVCLSVCQECVGTDVYVSVSVCQECVGTDVYVKCLC